LQVDLQSSDGQSLHAAQVTPNSHGRLAQVRLTVDSERDPHDADYWQHGRANPYRVWFPDCLLSSSHCRPCSSGHAPLYARGADRVPIDDGRMPSGHW